MMSHLSPLSVHRALPLAAVAALGLACGADAAHDHDLAPDAAQKDVWTRADGPPTAADVQAWDGSAALQANKQAAIDAARKAGADQDTIDLILAIGMIETNEMNACDRDATKDNQGLSKNYSAFNMNGDMLQRIGWSEAQGPDLNRQENAGAAVALLLKAIQTFSLDGFLCFHRGGSTALDKFHEVGRVPTKAECSLDATAYVVGVKHVADYLKAHPEDRTSPRRIALFIQHV